MKKPDAVACGLRIAAVIGYTLWFLTWLGRLPGRAARSAKKSHKKDQI